MSSLNVHDINGISTYGNEVRIPSGSSLNVVGEVDAATVDISTRLDLPQPFGPTIPVNPSSIKNVVFSENDLKPVISSFLNFIYKFLSITFLNDL